MPFKMTRRLSAQVLIAIAAIAAPAAAGAVHNLRSGRPPVLTGAAAIHDLTRIGGHYCFAGHVHFGSSSAQPSAAKARAEAIQSWFDLVDLEYGDQWSSFAIAANKNVACAQSGTGWGCEVHAIPCSR